MSTPTGIGTLFGVFDGTNNPTTTYKELGGSAATARALIGGEYRFKPDATIDDVNNGNGKPSGFSKRRGLWTLNIDLYVRAATKAAARLAIYPPADLSVVTLANIIASGNTLINGNWVYKSGGEVTLNEGEAKLTIELFRYFDGDGTEIPAATMVLAIT